MLTKYPIKRLLLSYYVKTYKLLKLPFLYQRGKMKIQPYVKKLETSKVFRDFKREYSDAFLVAGFFVIDYETGMNLHQIDYYLPSKRKVAAFTLDGKVDLKVMEMMDRKVPEKLDLKTKVDLDALRGILQDEMKNRNITENIKKIIAVIQSIDRKKVWVLNCILSGMEILKAHIDDESETVLSMERASILDYVKKLPSSNAAQRPLGKGELDKQIKQLDKLKAELEKEKSGLGKNRDNPDGSGEDFQNVEED